MSKNQHIGHGSSTPPFNYKKISKTSSTTFELGVTRVDAKDYI
jgi:hypothetical protein